MGKVITKANATPEERAITTDDVYAKDEPEPYMATKTWGVDERHVCERFYTFEDMVGWLSMDLDADLEAFRAIDEKELADAINMAISSR